MGPAYVALGCAAVVWGLAFPIMKFAVERLGPLDVGVSRMAFGAAGGLGLLLLTRPDLAAFGPALRRHAPTLLILSLMVGYGQTFALTYGIAGTPATTASLIPPLNPICTMLLAAWVLGERIIARQWLGLGLAVAGVVLLGFRHGRPTWAELAGPLTLAVAPISWGFYTVLSKPILAELRPLQLNAVTLLGGFLLLAPWASGEMLGRLGAGTLAEWGAVLYLGLLTMAVAYALWYFGLARIGAAATGATALGIPLVGVAGSWLLLGESLGVVVVLAGILILGGLHLVLGVRRG
jgi:drug/metabolite transporter (DMT)-like permease